MWYLIEKHRPLKCQVNSLDYGSVLGKKKPNLFDFNGSSLSSIFPETSSVTSPDYTNFNSNIANSQIQNNVNLSNPVADFQKSGSQIVNDTAFKTGQALSSSSNLSTKMQGQQMVKDSINDPSGQRFQQNSTQNETQNQNTSKTSTVDGLKSGFSALSQIGDKVGGTAGKVMSGVGNVGSSVINLTEQAKAAGGFKNLSGAAKANGVAGAAGAAADLIGSFMPRKTEYDGPKGNITETMDTVYDSISDAAMSIPGPGMMIGGIMKAGAVLGKGMNALGGGTDGMTTTDAILGSSFFNLTPMGLINGFGGKKADTITKNTDAFDTVGSSYSGTNAKVDDALTKSGKKYGLFSSSARQEANREIAEAKRQQRVVADIADQSRTNTALQQSMSAINSNKRKLALEGGYDQASVRAGKQGMAIEHKPTQISLVRKISEFREGGNVKIQSTQIMLTAAIPEFKNGGSVNVLPDGALHARKHHMEVEGITEKGIPVIDNNGKQQAEIEHSEIIFRLEVTEKLEELEKKYSESNDDKYALEAGELLVKEILHNTDDRTGLIDTLKKGGTLNLHNNVSPTQSDIDNMVKQALINILTK